MPVLEKNRPITNKLARALFGKMFMTKSRTLIWPEICEVVDSYSESEYFAALGTAPQVEQVDDDVEADTKEFTNYTFTYKNLEFLAKVEIKRNLIEYDQTGETLKIPGKMAARVVNFPDKHAMRVLRDGTDATKGLCIFGGAFFQTSHNVGGEGPAAQSNLITGTTATADYDGTTLREDLAQKIQNDFDRALVQMVTWQDDRSEPVYEAINPGDLMVLCGPKIYNAMKIALGAHFIKQTENIFPGAVGSIQMSTYLPSTGAEAADWYLIHKGTEMRPLLFSRFRLKTDADMQDKVGDLGALASKFGVSTEAIRNFSSTEFQTNLGDINDSWVINRRSYLMQARFKGVVTYGDPRAIVKVDNAAS